MPDAGLPAVLPLDTVPVLDLLYIGVGVLPGLVTVPELLETVPELLDTVPAFLETVPVVVRETVPLAVRDTPPLFPVPEIVPLDVLLVGLELAAGPDAVVVWLERRTPVMPVVLVTLPLPADVPFLEIVPLEGLLSVDVTPIPSPRPAPVVLVLEP